MNVHKNNDKDWYGIDIDDCDKEKPPFPIAVAINLCEMVPGQAWALPTPCCPCVLTWLCTPLLLLILLVTSLVLYMVPSYGDSTLLLLHDWIYMIATMAYVSTEEMAMLSPSLSRGVLPITADGKKVLATATFGFYAGILILVSWAWSVRWHVFNVMYEWCQKRCDRRRRTLVV